jgi:hypothetical protein
MAVAYIATIFRLYHIRYGNCFTIVHFPLTNTGTIGILKVRICVMCIEIPINDPNFVNVDLLPPGGMHFYLLPDGETFVVTKDRTVDTSLAGFITDLASIPKGLRSLISVLGKHFVAAVLHDLWYRVPWTRHGVRKEMADTIFLEEMADLGVPWWKRRAMYRGVRVGGASSWVETPPPEEEE